MLLVTAAARLTSHAINERPVGAVHLVGENEAERDDGSQKERFLSFNGTKKKTSRGKVPDFLPPAFVFFDHKLKVHACIQAQWDVIGQLHPGPRGFSTLQRDSANILPYFRPRRVTVRADLFNLLNEIELNRHVMMERRNEKQNTSTDTLYPIKTSDGCNNQLRLFNQLTVFRIQPTKPTCFNN